MWFLNRNLFLEPLGSQSRHLQVLNVLLKPELVDSKKEEDSLLLLRESAV
jgi:hypothetical protein